MLRRREKKISDPRASTNREGGPWVIKHSWNGYFLPAMPGNDWLVERKYPVRYAVC